MSIWWKLGLSVVVLVALAVGVIRVLDTYRNAIVDAETAKQALVDEQTRHTATKAALALQEKETEGAKARADKLDQLVQEKAREAEKSEAAVAAFQIKFDQLKLAKPAIKAWADQPIPPDVLDLLRAGADEVVTTGGRAGEARRGAGVDDDGNRRDRTRVPGDR